MTVDAAALAGVTAGLVERWRNLTLADLPAEALEVARQCVLDWTGCALAGSREPLAQILSEQVAAAEPGASTLLGRSQRCGLRTAALVNGAAGHALDFDDTHMFLIGHPTVPVLPAALALAEQHDLSGERLLVAFVAGVELECRVGALLNPGHYRLGWHATGSVGVFGAATACAHLLDLGAEPFGHAIGLAGTQSAGLKASFGTMAKPLHAGKAASDGLLAALLASGGFTGNPAIVEAPQGLAAAAAGQTIDPSRLERLEGRFLIRSTLFKYHAACYLTHAAINATLSLREQVSPEDVESIELWVAPEVLDVCNIAEPRTGLEGKFSLRATAAMALLGDDTADLGSYNDSRMNHPDLVSLRDRVQVVPTEGRASTQAKVVVATRDGRRLEADGDTGVPAPDLALQLDRLSAKFRALATPVLGAERALALEEAIGRLETLRSVRELLDLTVA